MRLSGRCSACSLGLIAPVQAGSRTALLAAILPGDAFVAGRSLFRVVAQSAQVVGNATGGLLLAATSPRGALAVDAGTFAASALLVRLGTCVRPARSLPSERPSLVRDSLGGVRSVLAYPLLRRVLLLGWLVPAFSVAPEALAAPGVPELGGGGIAVGIWLASLPAGVIVGELASLWLIPPPRRGRAVVPLACWVFLPYVLFVLEPRLELAVLLLFLAGLGHGYSLGLDALILRHAPEPLRDRVFTVYTAGLMAIQGLGFAAAGALAEVVPPHVAIVVAAGCGLTAIACFAPRAPTRRRLRENASVAAILGGIAAALCWGASTFCSSRSTRLIGSPSVLAWVMLIGFVVVAPVAALRGVTGDAGAGDVAWLAVSSIGSVGGLGMSYAALRRGKVSIIAPICATEGAIAAVIAVAFGQRLAATTLVALGVIAGGVILASTGNEIIEGHSSRVSVALAVLAASLFGVSLYASGRVGPSLGTAAILLGARGLGVAVIVLPLLVQRRLRLKRAAVPFVVTSGVLEVAGYAAFIIGVGSGDVAVPAVLSSLFAVVAGVLGFMLLGERLRRLQFAGVAATVVGVIVLSGLQA
jgi:drug/metabolite transporter (DMT)-like permease